MNPTDNRLHILVIVSRPLGRVVVLEHGGQQVEAVSPIPLLAVEMVRQGLHRVFLDDGTPTLVRYLPWARLEDVQTALAEPYDVVHLVGHGAEDGCLLLEAEDGTTDLVTPARLAKALGEAGVRLAFLSACFSGAAGRALHQAGIPNVVMVDEHYPMDARAAALFNRLFYARLTRGGSPGQAFEAGLRAVRTSREFGDDAPLPQNPYTGEIEPRYGERFDKILDDDRPLVKETPSLGYKELSPSGVVCTVPREEIFVGREAEMIEAIRQVQTARLVTLHGPGGIGKTALARQVALWHADRRLFRDGVIEVRAENAHDENDLVDRLADALRQISPDFQLDPRQPWVSLRATLAGRWLVLLDSAEDLSPGAVACLGEQLLARLNELHLLVTSHAPLNLIKYEQTIGVEQLPVGWGEWVGPAERMFIAYTPQKRQAEVFTRHFDAMQAICRQVEGYPLGILLEVAQLHDEKETPEHLLEVLQANMVKALRYAQAADLPPRHKSVGAVLKGAYEKLGATARRLLAHIAVFPGGAMEEMLDALEESGWREAEREVRGMRLASWAAGRYRMLAPLRAWAQTTLPSDELNAYRLGAARWLNEQAGMWDAVLRPGKERRTYAQQLAEAKGQKVEEVEMEMTRAALATFDRERENLLAAVKWAYDAKEGELAWQLAERLFDFFNIRALWIDWEQTHELALEAARKAGDRYGECVTLGNLGLVYAKQGHWDEAIAMYEKALDIAQVLDNRFGEGVALTNLGMVYRWQDRLTEAIEKYEQAQSIFRELGRPERESYALMNLGNVYLQQGRWAEAVQCYERALAIFREQGNRHGEGQTLANLGLLYEKQGDQKKAVALWREALGKLHPDSPEYNKVAEWLPG